MAANHILSRLFWTKLSRTQHAVHIAFLMLASIGLVLLNIALVEDWILNCRVGIYGTSEEQDKFDVNTNDELIIFEQRRGFWRNEVYIETFGDFPVYRLQACYREVSTQFEQCESQSSISFWAVLIFLCLSFSLICLSLLAGVWFGHRLAIVGVAWATFLLLLAIFLWYCMVTGIFRCLQDFSFKSMHNFSNPDYQCYYAVKTFFTVGCFLMLVTVALILLPVATLLGVYLFFNSLLKTRQI